MKNPSPLTRLAVLGLALGLIASSALRAESTEKPAEKPVPPGALKKFDKDGDGKLSDEERAAWNAAREAEKKAALKKYDTNQDGKLDQAERDAMKADREKKKPQPKQSE